MKLTVVLGASGEASFDILLNDNDFVRKWIKELRWCLDNCNINQNEAFANFQSIDDAIKEVIQSSIIINKYLKNFIEIRLNLLDQPQSYFNYLHLKFEQLSGEFGKPSRLFSIANQELKNAIRNVNFYIHKIEKKIFWKTLYFSFNKDQYRRIPLDKTDYDNFEFEVEPGSLCLHYAELGKTYVDLYTDELPIDYDMTKNLHFYSGEASLAFDEFSVSKHKGFIDWMTKHNLDPYDKNLGHGKIVLGKVLNLEDSLSKIRKYNFIKEIQIKE
jgi:hypothetical protein